MPFIYLGMFVHFCIRSFRPILLRNCATSMLFLFFLNACAHQREVIIYFRKITLAHVGTKSTLWYWRRKTIRYFDSVHPLIRRIIYLYCPKGKTFHSSFLNLPTNINYLNLPPPPSRIKRISYPSPIVKKNLRHSAPPR
jgi:hypothetical protein